MNNQQFLDQLIAFTDRIKLMYQTVNAKDRWDDKDKGRVEALTQVMTAMREEFGQALPTQKNA